MARIRSALAALRVPIPTLTLLTRYVCMQRKITLNMGMRMNGWYDLYSIDKINAVEDTAGLHESLRCSCDPLLPYFGALLLQHGSKYWRVFMARYVESLITQEVAAGVPASRILVGGFSQGDMLQEGSQLHSSLRWHASVAQELHVWGRRPC